MMVHDVPDHLLVEQWSKHADERAWRFLMNRYDRLIRKILVTLGIKNGEDVEDLLQDFWWEQSLTIHRWKGNSSLATYLAVAIKRRGIDLLRRQIKKRRTHSDHDLEEITIPTSQNEDFNLAFLRQALKNSFDRLDPEDRLLFFYRELEGWSTAETAKALGVPEGTVKSRLSRIKQKLQAMMKEEGWNGTELA